MQRAKAPLFELVDPALGDLADRDRIQVVQLFPPPPDRHHQIGLFQERQVLGGTLPRHVDVLAQLAQGLAVVLAQPVEHPPAARIGKGLEHAVGIGVHAGQYATKWLHVKRGEPGRAS